MIYLVKFLPPNKLKMWYCFEGCDRVGKTTQCRLLAEKIGATIISVPDRNGTTGQLINSYLTNKDVTMHPASLHLLFTLNRWEITTQMEKMNNHVITDRWSASGIIYSISRGLETEWCQNAETYLPQPDLTIWLDADPEVLQTREGWGVEREETIDKQTRIRYEYQKFFENKENVIRIDVSHKNVHEIHEEILSKLNYK